MLEGTGLVLLDFGGGSFIWLSRIPPSMEELTYNYTFSCSMFKGIMVTFALPWGVVLLTVSIISLVQSKAALTCNYTVIIMYQRL